MKQGDSILAEGLLEQAIDAYRRGFEADWRDAYPGVNAVTLMELKQPPDPERERLLPLVAYATERRIAAGKPDYWDYATLLELAVLARDEKRAKLALRKAVSFYPREVGARDHRPQPPAHPRGPQAPRRGGRLGRRDRARPRPQVESMIRRTQSTGPFDVG